MADSGDQVIRILVSSWVFTGLSAIFLVLRIGCKLQTRRELWLDDWVLVISWIALVAQAIMTTSAVPLGLGQHVWNVPVENLGEIGLRGNINGTWSVIAASLSKTAFALTLLRLMGDERRARIFLWFAIISMNVFLFLNALFQWVKCSPISKTWNVMEPGTCWHPGVQTHYGIFAAGYSALMDIVLAFLPWRLLQALQMRLKEKLGVGLAMSLGVFAGITSMFKTYYIPTLEAPDFTYNICELIVWGSAETAVTIVAVSIPILRTLLKEVKASSRKNPGVSTNKSHKLSRIVQTRTITVTSEVIPISQWDEAGYKKFST